MNASHLTRRRILSSTAAKTLTRGAHSTDGGPTLGAIIDNTGAVGSVTITLPADAEPGDFFDVDVVAAQAFVIYAGTTGVFTGLGLAGTAGQSLRNSGTAYEAVQIVCTGA